MKKYAFVVLFIFISANIYAQAGVINRSKKEFTGTIGTGYASKAEKFGLDLGGSYLYAFDKLFAAGFEADFFWINWKRELGTKEIGQTTAAVKAVTSAYNIPVFFDAQVRFPIRLGNALLEPSVNIGLGWDFMILQDSIPEYQTSSGETISKENKIKFYHSFAWQFFASCAYKPESSDIAFLVALGYRGMFPSNSGIEFNMSGFLAKLGVKFYIGSN